jgi:hypothetical protein
VQVVGGSNPAVPTIKKMTYAAPENGVAKNRQKHAAISAASG